MTDRVGSIDKAITLRGVDPKYVPLVIFALALDCHYRQDHCDHHRDEEGFTRCQPCVTRDAAEAVNR